jgi:C-terminal processing protease CtpA/Prc
LWKRNVRASHRKLLMKFIVVSLCIFLASHSSGQFSAQQQDRPLSVSGKQQLMDTLIRHLVDGYVFEDAGIQMGKALKIFQKGRSFAQINSFQGFADSLNTQFLRISNDKHLRLLYSYDTVPVQSEQEVSFPDFIKQFAVNNNYGFNKLEILQGNIGYMNILGFFPFDEARDNAIAAFHFVENTAALIIDLRQNNGGESNINNFVISYFFGPQPVNFLSTRFRKNNRIEQFWSAYYLPGKRYLNKPVYVLTSPQTFSAGEAMAFVLQSLTKATVVGERTGGGANMCDLVRLNAYLVLNLPVASPAGLVSEKNWEGRGVIPDLEIAQGRALDAAHSAALKVLADRAK